MTKKPIAYIASIVVGLAMAAGAAYAQAIEKAGGTYEVDPAHTHVVFSINHIGFADTRGQFRKVSGTFMLDPDNLEKSGADIVIDTGSIDTNHGDRDDHLRTADFFDAEKFPTISFKSTRVKRTGESTAKLTGDVTLHGVTKPVTLDVVLRNAGPHPFDPKVYRTGWSAETTILRSDFGMEFGLPLIGDEVTLNFEVEGSRM